MASSMNELSSRVRDVIACLECPVCLSAFGDCVRLCNNGHSVCGTCASNSSVAAACPVCRAPFSGAGTRNHALESIVATGIAGVDVEQSNFENHLDEMVSERVSTLTKDLDDCQQQLRLYESELSESTSRLAICEMNLKDFQSRNLKLESDLEEERMQRSIAECEQSLAKEKLHSVKLRLYELLCSGDNLRNQSEETNGEDNGDDTPTILSAA